VQQDEWSQNKRLATPPAEAERNQSVIPEVLMNARLAEQAPLGLEMKHENRSDDSPELDTLRCSNRAAFLAARELLRRRAG
jgi:hypothetical protein